MDTVDTDALLFLSLTGYIVAVPGAFLSAALTIRLLRCMPAGQRSPALFVLVSGALALAFRCVLWGALFAFARDAWLTGIVSGWYGGAGFVASWLLVNPPLAAAWSRE